MRKLIVLLLLCLFTSVLFARPEAAIQNDDGCEITAPIVKSEGSAIASITPQIESEAPLPEGLAVPIDQAPETNGDIWDVIINIISDNWGFILSGLTYILYRFIPTKRADIIISLISWLWNTLIPDRKKGGGKHSI